MNAQRVYFQLNYQQMNQCLNGILQITNNYSNKQEMKFKTILLLNLFNKITDQPIHIKSQFFRLPKDILFQIFKFIANKS